MGLVQGHTSLAAVGVQETVPASAPTTAAVKLSHSPEVGAWTMEYRVWPTHSRCEITCQASQLQKDGLCPLLPSKSLTSESHQQNLNHIQNRLQGPLGNAFRVELDNEPANHIWHSDLLYQQDLLFRLGRESLPSATGLLHPCLTQPSLAS